MSKSLCSDFMQSVSADQPVCTMSIVHFAPQRAFLCPFQLISAVHLFPSDPVSRLSRQKETQQVQEGIQHALVANDEVGRQAATGQLK